MSRLSGRRWPGGSPTGGISTRIRVIYFASYREFTGLTEEEFQLSQGSAVKALMKVVKSRHEALRDVKRILVAVNGEFAEPEVVLAEGDLVALFPPVSGG